LTAEEYLAGTPLGAAVYATVVALLEELGEFEVRTSRSQLSFRRRRGFAYLWFPGRYLPHPGAELVLSIALPREVPSPRWKEIAHPAPRIWQHHLEIQTLGSGSEESP
jgi:hypothetical protein